MRDSKGRFIKGHHASPETEFKKGDKPWSFGKKLSKEFKEKCRQRQNGKSWSPSTQFKTGEHAGANHPRWKGGISISNKRVYILKRDHPFAGKQGYILKSRLIVEKYLGRHLDPKEIVHHIDFNPLNNVPENLFVFEHRNAHCVFHRYLKHNLFLKNWLKSNII